MQAWVGERTKVSLNSARKTWVHKRERDGVGGGHETGKDETLFLSRLVSSKPFKYQTKAKRGFVSCTD